MRKYIDAGKLIVTLFNLTMKMDERTSEMMQQFCVAINAFPAADVVEKPAEEPYLEQMMAEVERSHSDEEIAHTCADEILCDLLKELGYERLVKAFNNVWKWYA